MTRIALLPILLTSVALAAETLPLASDDYTFTETHETKHPSVQLPRDPIPEKEYKPVKGQGVKHHLRFSEDRKTVKILPSGFVGQLENANAKKRVYELTQGTFAGGRLIIESTKRGMIATITVYGSGFPVIGSGRGELKPINPDAEQDAALKDQP